jgi:hypothetical protein
VYRVLPSFDAPKITAQTFGTPKVEAVHIGASTDFHTTDRFFIQKVETDPIPSKKESRTERDRPSVWRIDNQPAIHLSMKAFFVDGETLDCLAISSHLSRFFSTAEFGLVAAEAADCLAGAVVAGAGTAGVAGCAAFVFGVAAASGFVLALAERQFLTNALRLSPFSPFFSAAALQAFVFSC